MKADVLAEKFAVELATFHAVNRNEVELTFHDGDVAVPGFVAISGKTRRGVTRGWVRKRDGLVIIIRHTSLTPLVEALALADEPPPYDDDQVAEILTWGYGDRYTLLRSVNEGELGIRYALTAPPMREVRESDGAMVFRWLVRIENADGPIIMHYQIERLVDGEHKYNGWQLAPKEPDYLDEDDEWTESASSPSSPAIAESKINNDEPWHQALVGDHAVGYGSFRGVGPRRGAHLFPSSTRSARQLSGSTCRCFVSTLGLRCGVELSTRRGTRFSRSTPVSHCSIAARTRTTTTRMHSSKSRSRRDPRPLRRQFAEISWHRLEAPS